MSPFLIYINEIDIEAKYTIIYLVNKHMLLSHTNYTYFDWPLYIRDVDTHRSYCQKDKLSLKCVSIIKIVGGMLYICYRCYSLSVTGL